MAADRFPKPRIVLADPNQRMREAVVRVLNTKCEVEVVGYALDGAGTVDAAIGLHPDILILDIIMSLQDLSANYAPQIELALLVPKQNSRPAE